METKEIIDRKMLKLGKIKFEYKSAKAETNLTLSIGYRSGKSVIDLLPTTGYQISICGEIWNSSRSDCITCGQCIDTIADQPEFKNNKNVQRIREIWDRWHLGDLSAGTRKQTDFLNNFESTVRPLSRTDRYTDACAVLDEAGLLVDRGYKYGNEWLFEPVPTEIIQELIVLFKLNEQEASKVTNAATQG